MVRNLYIVNTFPFRPTLFCLKIIDSFESNRMAIISKTGDENKRAKQEINISNILFKSEDE